MKFLNKIKFCFQKQKAVMVTGRAADTTQEALFQVLRSRLNIGREVLIYQSGLPNPKELKKFKFLIKRSRQPVLVATHAGEYHPEKEFFAGELSRIAPIKELARVMPSYGYLVLNFDDETVRDLKKETSAHVLTFGFGAGAAVRATDVVLTQTPALGTNFKINYQGNLVPVWLEKLFGKEHIYSALSAAAVGEILGLNLVEVSSALKFYRGLPGKMRLIEGIKKSWILDDSESATPLSMAEALSVLGKINAGRRKIAVLGDIVGVGQYTIESHEALGERAARAAHLLFTVGPRAKFIAQGAVKSGMAQEKIFQFSHTQEAGLALQKEMREGDLILIDGSKEMKMKEIVEEIKYIAPTATDNKINH